FPYYRTWARQTTIPSTFVESDAPMPSRHNIQPTSEIGSSPPNRYLLYNSL
ncbi:hypothetical protein QBC45DRAFT_321810, partial [Copromyces sp. CBS 386.78]